MAYGHLPYSNQIANGVNSTDLPATHDLFASDRQPITDQAQAGAVALGQFVVAALDETGKLVAWNPDAGAATGSLTFSGVGTADDTITINGVVITLKAAAAGAHEATIGASATATAQAVKAVINADPDAFEVVASGAAAVLTLTAIPEGQDGNQITTTESGTATAFGAGTLVGGGNETESKATCVTAQPIAANEVGPIYTAADFNHEALTWPAGVTTLPARKAAFAGTPIGVRQLL